MTKDEKAELLVVAAKCAEVMAHWPGSSCTAILIESGGGYERGKGFGEAVRGEAEKDSGGVADASPN